MANERLKDCSLEEQVIILCAQIEMSGQQQTALDRLVQNKDVSWQKVLKKAEWYRTSAFLLYHLRHLDCQDAIPPWVMDELKQIYFRNGCANLQMRSELQKVLFALGEDGTPAIALKGVALLETVYPNRCLRPMSDIDLLVPEEKADAVQSRVMEFGYLPMGTPEQQESQREVHHHLPRLVEANKAGVIEVHSHIVPRNSEFRFDISSFWERAVPHKVAGVNALILAPEHQLIHVALHFFLSRRFGSRRGLSQICDIAETLRHYQNEIDWIFFEQEIVNNGLQMPTYCGLFLAQSLLGAPVPSDFLSRIRSNEVSEAGMDLFLRRRVLGDRRAVACQLVKPGESYNVLNLVSGAVHRLFTNRIRLESRYQAYEASPVSAKGHLSRFKDGITLLAQYRCNPWELWKELKVENWIHSISATAAAGSRPESGDSRPFPNNSIKQEDQAELRVC